MSQRGARALLWFWVAILAIALAGAVVLQSLGPPPNAARSAARSTAQTAPAAPPAPAAIVTRPEAVAADGPGRTTAGPIAAPDPGLLEIVDKDGAASLPKVSADGRLPMQVYAGGFDRSNRRPRVAILLAGIGLNHAESLAAIQALPGAVTLAFSPYASDVGPLLDAARIAQHEYLISLPLEPEGSPINDAGDHALLTSLDASQNRARLDWSLGRIEGYAGATGALGAMRGERFAQARDDMDPVLETLATRGLMYVDPRPLDQAATAHLPHVWSRRADLVIDEPAGPAAIDAKLRQLTDLAQQHGSALGIVGAATPVTVARIVAWANTLDRQNVALAPVSALAVPPGAELGGAEPGGAEPGRATP